MWIYTNCLFCRAEINPSNVREAYCNKDCKLHKEVYGSLSNYKKNKPKATKGGSRKTNRKQSKQSPKPLKNAKQASTIAHRDKGTKKGKLPLSIPVKTRNGKEALQFLLIMDYGEIAPHALTGGAILIETGGENEDNP
jgi:ribosomal protein L44E